MIHTLQKLVESSAFQNFVSGVILFSALLVGLETLPYVKQGHGPLLIFLEQLVIGIFSVEIALRIGAYGKRPWRFFKHFWNVFDFLIVAVCFLPETQFVAVLRLVRILRIMRLLATVQQRELERLKNVELTRAYRELEAEKAKSERLLLNILPTLIAQRLKGGAKIIADSCPEASVLFADIVGFTKLSASISPERLVGLLDDIFSRFDRLVEIHAVEKIKTIGDAYMVVAGVPESHPRHAQAVADLALDMLKALADFNRERGYALQVRIGIHTGPVVAGIIGHKKFIYDLWGDTVNTASRMESHSLPGKIQVTESVRAALAGEYRLVPRGEMEIKGKGPMRTYFLEGREADTPPTPP